MEFQRSQLLQHNKEAQQVCDGHLEPVSNTKCCRDKLLSEDVFVTEAECFECDFTEVCDHDEEIEVQDTRPLAPRIQSRDRVGGGACPLHFFVVKRKADENIEKKWKKN